jgi:endoglucanase
MPSETILCQVRMRGCSSVLVATLLPYALVPYVVGSNPNSPSNPHSSMASGGNGTDNIDTSPPQEAYILYGAIVGGPDKKDRFYDIRSDWPETEVTHLLSYMYPPLDNPTR